MAISRAEQFLARSLRSLPDLASDDEILNSGHLVSIASGLEQFVPQILAERDRSWQSESLDGVFPTVFHRKSPWAITVAGSAILITDQTFVPLQVELQGHPVDDVIVWAEVRLGERGSSGMIRSKYAQCYLASTLPSGEDWAYAVTFGEKAVVRYFNVSQYRTVVATMMAGGWAKIASCEDIDDFESVTLQRSHDWVVLEWSWESAWMIGPPSILDQMAREYSTEFRKDQTDRLGGQD